MTPFERKVLTVVSRIPPGRVATYGDVARLAGKPRAARAVGNILREANRPGLPYHRVIAAGGRLGGYTSLALKRSLLAAEGLTVAPGRVVGFSRVRWPAFGREAGAGVLSPKRREILRRTGAGGRKKSK
jgi:O-6-methylguanine DNA methyltransferase